MWLNCLSLTALLVTALSLITVLEPWFQSWSGNRTHSANVLTIALGDSRRLFAKHAYVKADAYFHGGYYPSIYDNAPSGESHMSASVRSSDHDEEQCGTCLGKPKDWLDAFSRHFYPSTHRHMGDDHEDGHGSGKASAGEEREMLPWLKLSATLDPEQVQTYVVAAYWMRTRLGKINEAEQFLREGLRANPGNRELLFELGRIYFEYRKDPNRARNLWELAFRDWKEKPTPSEPDYMFLGIQILGNLAKLEEDQGNYARALALVTELQTISPHKGALQKWIDELKPKAASEAKPAS